MMNNKIVAIILSGLMAVSLTGCGQSKTGTALKNIAETGQAVELSVNMDTDQLIRMAKYWQLPGTDIGANARAEVDQLNTYPNIRTAYDDILGIVRFANNSKNGVIYIDSEGNWTGNTTLYNAFRNKVFVNDYWRKKLKESDAVNKMRAACAEDYGVEINNANYELMLTLDSYYGLFNTDWSFKEDMLETLVSRKDALAILYKAESPVDFLSEESNCFADFDTTAYAVYGSQVIDCSYLTLEDGSLNAYSYYEPITKAEVVYMLIKKYYPAEYESAEIGQSYEGIRNRGDLFDAFNVDKNAYWKMQAFEACLQNHEDGLTEDLLKALKVAKEHNIIGRVENWYEPYSRYDFLLTLTSTYNSLFTDATFPVTADMGANHVENDKAANTELGHDNGDIELGQVKKEDVSDAVALSNLRSIYGQEIDMTDEEIAKLIECSNEYDPDTNPDGYHYEIVDEYKTIKNTGDYGFLNFRYGPQVTYEMMTRIPEGTQVHIIAKCVETGWYRVISGETENGEGSKKVGYQCYAYLYND